MTWYSSQIRSSNNRKNIEEQTFEVLKDSYAETAKPMSYNHSSVLAPKKQSMSRYWIIKNPEVCKINFNNLWTVTKLFELDEWTEIASTQKLYFESDIINP